ncbi:MAG: citrate/2-methylcitrate synthase [Defluviitaleaceae bacterium]|nr:citrate/2-methylcitrate synthase [Defluviitaleaceae bacterium]
MAKNINPFSEVTPDILELTKLCTAIGIPAELYTEYNVYRGLRDLNGNGVRAGLTNICEVTAKETVGGVEHPADGKLYYRGIEIRDLVNGFLKSKRFGFEETVYLLLFGSLPDAKQLEGFMELLRGYYSLPPKFNRDVIMKAPSSDMMNTLARSVLTLYAYDDNADDISLPNVLRQCLQLIAMFPMLAVYGYQAYMHFHGDESLVIHQPNPSLSYAENIFNLLRHDRKYTELEARILDAALVLHAEHGGGNNSTFAVRVVSSSGTDTYSAVAAALGSLKGPKHGGANIETMRMMHDLKTNVSNTKDEGQVAGYLKKILRKDAYDRSGLIYGIGHAIYSLSDPRAVVFEDFIKQLSREKNREEEYELYALVARLAPELIAAERKIYKGVSANIDFYSGFVYDMLGLPEKLYTSIFAISRMAGWSAHRLEELHTSNRIIRPAYKGVSEIKNYVPIENR